MTEESRVSRTPDPQALLNAYAQIPNMNVIPLPFTPRSMAPLAFDALQAVLDLHAPAPGNAWCRHCGEAPFPCSTVRALTAPLEGS